jgi:uncharacterized protein (TIGR02231 family)
MVKFNIKILASTLALGYFINLFPSSINSQSNDSSIIAPIRDVVVYPDRAMVTRVTNIEVPTGKHKIRFKNGNPNLEPSSLRAESLDKNSTVLGISSYTEMNLASTNPEVKSLEDKIQNLENKNESSKKHIERLKKDLSGVEQYSKFLTYYISEKSTEATDTAQGSSWEDGIKILSKRRANTKSELQKVEKEIEATNQEKNILSQKLNKIQSTAQKTYRVIEVHVQSITGKPTSVAFSYVVPGASWKVSYGIQVSPQGKAKIEYYGNIRQETGEDWKNVNLSLSTASPAKGGSRYNLYPIQVSGRIVKTKDSIFLSEQKAMASTEAAEEPDRPAMESEGSPETGGYSKLEASGESLLFTIPRKTEILSTKKDQKVIIAQYEDNALAMSHRIIPSLQLAAHLTGKFMNSKSFPLLAGSVNSFLDSGFIGRSSLEYTAPGQSFLVGFGIDQSVQVNRNLKTYEEPVGALRSGKYFHTEIEVEIKNQSDEIKKFSLLDRIPVSEVEEISVELMPATTDGSVEDSKGILRWDSELLPRSKKTFKLHYRVRTPTNYQGEIYGN